MSIEAQHLRTVIHHDLDCAACGSALAPHKLHPKFFTTRVSGVCRVSFRASIRIPKATRYPCHAPVSGRPAARPNLVSWGVARVFNRRIAPAPKRLTSRPLSGVVNAVNRGPPAAAAATLATTLCAMNTQHDECNSIGQPKSYVPAATVTLPVQTPLLVGADRTS
ncbi:hypothetical protein VTK56DRAFT_6169 [Thermocarpiscus australiensis]